MRPIPHCNLCRREIYPGDLCLDERIRALGWVICRQCEPKLLQRHSVRPTSLQLDAQPTPHPIRRPRVPERAQSPRKSRWSGRTTGANESWMFPHIMGDDYRSAKHSSGRIDAYTASFMRWESKQHVQAWLGSFGRHDALRPIFLDTETTGTRSFSEVIEICLVDEYGKTVFQSLINPTMEIEPMATMVHGLTHEDVQDAPRFLQVYDEVMNYLRDHVIIAYNAAFDIRLLKQSAESYELRFPELHTACLMYAYAKYRGEYAEQSNGQIRCKTCRLEEAMVYEQLDMPPSHRAEQDAHCVHRLFHAMAAHN